MLVFQYGSNTSAGRINASDRLRGEAMPVAPARTVQGFEMVFDVPSRQNDCGAASIRRAGRHPVWGRLYEIPEELVRAPSAGTGTRCLDEIERNYGRVPIDVIRQDTGRPVRVWTYVSRSRVEGLRPSERYMAHIVAGLLECGAPEAYVERIRRVPTGSGGLAGRNCG